MELDALFKNADPDELKAFARRILRKSKKMPTVSEAYQRTRNEHWLKTNAAKSRWAYEADLLFKKHIEKPFGNLEIDAIGAKKIRQWHKSMIDSPVVANRALAVLSKIYSYMIEDEVIPQGTNPCSIVKRFQERERKRVPTESELRLIIAELLRLEPTRPRQVAFSFTLLFSGSRPSFLDRALKSSLRVDGDVGVLTLKGKTGFETVLIPPFALKRIQALTHIGPRLFGIRYPRSFLKAVFKTCGCDDLWGRDFRKAFASMGRNHGISMDTISELLNHSDRETTERYGILTDRSRIEAVGAISNVIEGLLDPQIEEDNPESFAGHQQTFETLGSLNP